MQTLRSRAGAPIGNAAGSGSTRHHETDCCPRITKLQRRSPNGGKVSVVWRWLVLGAVACGTPMAKPTGGDGPSGDTVEVMVMRTSGAARVPDLGRTVSFKDATHTVEVTTDDDGRAVAAFTGAGSVRLKNPNNLGEKAILGVEAGDRLCFGGCEPSAPVTAFTSAPLDIAPYPGASVYFLSFAGLEH